MTIRITIIGLGQIGASVGLALAEQGETIHRTGHDHRIETTRRAQKMGAIDHVAVNLPSAVREADIVLLSIPIDQLRETLEIIATELKDNAVVLDTSPVKAPAVTWVSELLPENRHYVGLTPVVNPTYLRQVETGLDAARADLFQRGLFAIVAPPNTSSEALKLAADLVGKLGAYPLFADPLEIDGLMAAIHILPQLMSAALLNATVDQPGWRESRKIAGPMYADIAMPLSRNASSKSLGNAALFNRENVLRVLDGAIFALQGLREDIDRSDAAALEAHLENARTAQARWIKERTEANWAAEGYPESVVKSADNVDVLTRLFGGGWKRKERK